MSSLTQWAWVWVDPGFMIKTLQEGDIEGSYLDIIKTIYDKLTANIILNNEKLKEFPLRSETKQVPPCSPLF